MAYFKFILDYVFEEKRTRDQNISCCWKLPTSVSGIDTGARGSRGLGLRDSETQAQATTSTSSNLVTLELTSMYYLLRTSTAQVQVQRPG